MNNKKQALVSNGCAVNFGARMALTEKRALWGTQQTYDGRPMGVREARPSGLPVSPEIQKHEQSTTIAGALGLPGNAVNAAGGALAGGAAGALLSRKNRLRNALLGAALGGAGTYVGSHLASGGDANTMLAGLGLGGKTAGDKSAFDFGKMLGDAGSYAKDLYNKIPAGALQGAGMGGLGGAALGGLAGLVAPGHEDVYDDEGNLVGSKQRGRFGAALRGLLGGGLLGAGAGAAAGHFAPQPTQQAFQALQGYGQQAHDTARNYAEQLARRLGYRGKSDTAPSATTATGGAGGMPHVTGTSTMPAGVDTRKMTAPTSPTRPETTPAMTAEGNAGRAHAAAPSRYMAGARDRVNSMEQAMTSNPLQSDFDRMSPEQQQALLQAAAQQQRAQELARLAPASSNLDAIFANMSGLDSNLPASPTLGR